MATEHDEERVSIPLDPEEALRGLMQVDPGERVRWYIVVAETGEPEWPPNPSNGFATEAEAEEFHRTVLRGDPRLEVRPVRQH
jgi:hypothetical protein